MASKRFEKGSEEWSMFREYWALCQQLWQPEGNDEYWEQVIYSTNEFYKKYKENNEIFAKEIALALVDTLDEKWRTNAREV